MKFIVNNQLVLLHPPQGPVAAHIGSFAKSLSEQGYAASSICRQVRLAASFSQWLKQQGVGLGTVTSALPAQYLQERTCRVRPCAGDAAALQHLIDFLRRNGAVPAEQIAPPRLTPVEVCTQAYEQHLREVRALASATIANYLPFIRNFLDGCFGKGRVMLSRLRAGDVVRFVQRQAPHLHPKRAKVMTCALRSFLQYVRFRGDVTLDLAAAVPVVANWSMPEIPRAIEADQVRRLLARIDRRTAIGLRDYAILLLLARLGLRSSEVALLELDDLDWNTGRLNVRTKGGQGSEFPLPVDVGKAIAAYLRYGRPDSTNRRVFLRAKAPIRGFRGASGVGSVVRHSLQHAGVEAPTHGAHQFRHGLASEMLRQGASLAEIGKVLGHRHPQTTKIYTKVDIHALRMLALPWPGGAR